MNIQTKIFNYFSFWSFLYLELNSFWSKIDIQKSQQNQNFYVN
jgi:hypothetical protein